MFFAQQCACMRNTNMARKSAKSRTPAEEAAHQERLKELAKAKAEARTKAALAPIDCNKRYDIETSLRILGVSRARLYQDIAADRLRVMKDGRRTFVHGSALIERSRQSSDAVAS
jgi:hypothetical protein